MSFTSNLSFSVNTYKALFLLVIKLFSTQSRLLTTLKKKALENTVGKEENAGNQHFLLFSQCFLLLL